MKMRKRRIMYMFIMWLENDSFDPTPRKSLGFSPRYSRLHIKA